MVLFQKKTIPADVDPYVQRHLAALGRLLWEDADGQPVHLLGDPHWVRLMASYFALISEVVIEPALRAGAFVVTDNWYFKFFARVTIDTGYPREDFDKIFEGIGQPTEVFYLDVDPEVAAARKAVFTQGELGEHQCGHRSPGEGFVGYQSKVAAFYRGLARERKWQVIEPGTLTPAELAEVVVEDLGAR